MSDSGIGFSVKRFVIFIVACAIIIVVFEGMGDVGGSMIKGQVSRTTSKYHPEKNVEDRIKPAFVLEDNVRVADATDATDTTDASLTDIWNAEGSCEQIIETGDMLQFNLKEMKVSAACETVTVTLNHTGKLPAVSMGHNWVLTKSSDYMDIGMAGIAAGVANNYVPQNDARVIAYSKIIGGGESTTVTFSTADLSGSEEYTFFCSFLGHYTFMKGSFKVIA